MKTKFQFLTLIATIFYLSINIEKVSAQWVSSGPDGGYVKCMTKSGNNIYAATGFFWLSSPGFYKSEDNGGSWTSVSSSSLPVDIRAIANFGNSLFLGTGSGIYRSDDNGLTWIEKNNGFPHGDKWINHLAISGNTIFAAGTNEGILRSTDNGEHWTVVNSGLTDTYLYSLTASETAVFAGTGDQMLGVFRSMDNGNSWQQVKNGMSYYDNGIWLTAYAPMITSLAFIGSDLYAGTDESQGIWKTSDNGESWKFTSMETMNYQNFTAISGNGSVVLAGSRDGGGVIKSVDGGTSWSVANNGIDNYGGVTSFLIHGNSFLTGTKGGIYKSENNGNSWSWAGRGILAHNAVYPGFAQIGSTLFFGSQTGGVYRSPDEGNTWLNTNNGLPINEWNLSQLYSNKSALFVWDRVSLDSGNTWEMASIYSPGSTQNGYSGPRWLEHNGFWFTLMFNENTGAYRSSDQGQNWSAVNNGIQDPESAMFFIESLNEMLFLGTSDGLYFSGNNGDFWTKGIFPNLNYWALNGATLTSTGSSEICGLRGGGGIRGIYRTTDQGANWVQVSEFLVHKFIKNGNVLLAAGTNTELVNGELVEIPRIFMSADDGLNWTNISGSIPNVSTISLTGDGINLFISSYEQNNHAIYCSPDNGTSWVNITEGISENSFVSSFFIVNEKIFAATNGNSVWQRNLGDFAPPLQPDQISGIETPCIGSTVHYSVANTEGVNYSWQVPQDWTILSGNGTNSITVYAGNATGIVLVIPSNGFGNGPSQYKLVNPVEAMEVSVVITEDQNNVCEGSFMTFSTFSTNGGTQPTFNWFVNGEAAGDNTPEFVYIPSNGDEILLLFTSSETCTVQNQVESNSITTVVNSIPEVEWLTFEPDSLCINWAPVLLSGASPEGGFYSGDGVSNSIFDPLASGTGSHLITYTYTDTNNCSGVSTKLFIVNSCLGIQEINTEIMVYPNPASEKLNVLLNDGKFILKIELLNQVGSIVFSKENLNVIGQYSIPVSNFPTGIYTLRVSSSNKTFTKSIILH
ncbi:MAG: two component regulator propeller domain-containing [Bacteroidetes bacterium]|nr:MAG: two component regulator propeller domain-containing [Bacteroidota bacterium]